MLGSRLGVVQDDVAVGEGAALRVLAGQADRDALDEQAREGERLRVAPVDAARVERVDPSFEHLLELRVDDEALGNANELLGQLPETLGRDARLDGGLRGYRCALPGRLLRR